MLWQIDPSPVPCENESSFAKRPRHSIFLVFLNSISRIRDIEIEKISIFQMITKSDASTGGKLHSVIHHIGFHCVSLFFSMFTKQSGISGRYRMTTASFFWRAGRILPTPETRHSDLYQNRQTQVFGLNLGKIQNISLRVATTGYYCSR